MEPVSLFKHMGVVIIFNHYDLKDSDRAETLSHGLKSVCRRHSFFII